MNSSLFIIFFVSFLLVGFATSYDLDHDDNEGGGGSSSSIQCTDDLPSLKFPFSTANFTCISIWLSKGFVLMYQHTNKNVWRFVLKASDNNGYISVGFSESGNMVESSAVAGWIPSNGNGIVKQYYLSGKKSSDCRPDTGSFDISKTTIVRQASTSKLYMAFQINSTTTPNTKLIYAVGSQPSSNDHMLPMHSSMSKSTVDFTTQSCLNCSPPPPSNSGHHQWHGIFGFFLAAIIWAATVSAKLNC